ncbi:MAG: NUDIX hydrolase [Anaerolineae bacterium]|nr:NUDIX hydrolase [Anaerolineae bacterium]
MTEGKQSIRIRASIAVVQGGKILLVPHYFADGRPVEWFLPGGGVKYGEAVRSAAVREFQEETGLAVECGELLGISERIEPETPWHGLTIAFRGVVTGGELVAEMSKYSQYGDKTPKWFTLDEINRLTCQPLELIQKALA